MTGSPETLSAGKLREEIAKHGHAWTVDPRLADADPLPEYGRGGEVTEESRTLVPEHPAADSLHQKLKKNPPGNPLMRARWAELGLLEES